ncbi:MAG TPA: response regulator transcription factor [Dehalococcoidales bacterium]
MALDPEEKNRTISILLAEDHVIVRESIRQSLERHAGFKVVGEANDGEEAVRMAQELKPDVIIMDISMPKLNGIEATRIIKANQPSVAILALTAYDYEQYVFPLLAAGAAGYLLKDVNSRELINAMETVHRGESVLHPAIAHKVLERFKRTGDHVSDEVTKILTD